MSSTRLTTLCADSAVLAVERFVPDMNAIALAVRSIRPTDIFPDSGQNTVRIHRWYVWPIQFLPFPTLTVPD